MTQVSRNKFIYASATMTRVKSPKAEVEISSIGNWKSMAYSQKVESTAIRPGACHAN